MRNSPLIILSLMLVAGLLEPAGACAEQPNIVIVLADDMGYGDLGCYGSPNIRTPEIDRMASEGAKLTAFYAAPVCAPSRVQIMTGCYHARVGLSYNPFPHAKRGINPEEHTLPEYLQEAGYATKLIGKWHLGDAPEFHPMKHGFDDFYGYPYSNDMWSNNPRSKPSPDADPVLLKQITEREKYTGYHSVHYIDNPDSRRSAFPPLPLYENEKVAETDPDQSTMTRRFTESAVAFIQRNKDKPFFLYLAHPMPHVPLFAGEAFAGTSCRGTYGDTVEEIDWGMGEIRRTLEELGLEQKTLVIFTSDNGPWLYYGVDGGSAGPLRDGKTSTYEGGVRVPAVFWMPGTVSKGLVSGVTSGNMDFLATVADLAGFQLDADRIIDSRSLMPVLMGETCDSPREYFHYFAGGRSTGYPNYTGIRDSRWKLRVEIKEDGSLVPIELFDLGEDPSERFDRKEVFPEIVDRLLEEAVQFNKTFRQQLRPAGVTDYEWK